VQEVASSNLAGPTIFPRHNGVMAVIRSPYVYQQEITDAVEKVSAEFDSDVVRIRYNFGEDWTGDEAIFFRIVLKDSSTTKEKLGPVARRIRDALDIATKPWDKGLLTYCNFRSESEQKTLKEESWS
jgi:hypothetical protein